PRSIPICGFSSPSVRVSMLRSRGGCWRRWALEARMAGRKDCRRLCRGEMMRVGVR
ncbi:MAG: hypothetical protein L6R35_007361, partial [Caloplaca aegaea]